MMKPTALLLVAAGLTATTASGAVIIVTPTSANASSVKAGSSAAYAIDGSGLRNSTNTADDNSITGTHFDYNGGTTSNKAWIWNDGDALLINQEWIEFDLGQEYQLTGAYVWQTTFSTAGRQTRTFDIDTSTDDLSYSNVVTDTLLPQVNPVGTTIGSTATWISFGVTPVTARYVRFEIDGTYERTGGDRNWLGGIGEAKFAAVPEPASLALLGLGGLLMRRWR